MVPTTLVFHVDRYYAGVYALFHLVLTLAIEGLPCWLRGKERAGNAGDVAGAAGSIPGSGRSPGNGNGNPLQYSCLETPMDSPWGCKRVGYKIETKQRRVVE